MAFHSDYVILITFTNGEKGYFNSMVRGDIVCCEYPASAKLYSTIEEAQYDIRHFLNPDDCVSGTEIKLYDALFL